MSKVFVYGSLLSGLHNHRQMRGATLLGPARTIESVGWALFSLGAFPAMALTGGLGAVRGEVYEVGGRHLARLDSFEGVSSGFYVRQEVLVVVEGQGVSLTQAYVQTPEQVREREQVPGGCWRRWKAVGEGQRK